MPPVIVHLGPNSDAALWEESVGSRAAGSGWAGASDGGGRLWIASSPPAASVARRRMASMQVAAGLSPGVVTSQQLAGKVLAQLAEPSQARPLDEVMRRQLVAEVVQQRKTLGRLEHYGRLTPWSSLIELLDSEVQSARLRGAKPGHLLSQAKQLGEGRLQEFAEVYAEYCRSAEASGLLDTPNRWRQAARLLDAHPEQTAWSDVAIDALAARPKPERDFLAAVLRRAEHAAVSLPHHDWQTDEETSATLSWLEEVVGKITIVQNEPATVVSKDLAFLNAGLFHDPASIGSPPELAPVDSPRNDQPRPHGIRVLPGESAQDEIEQVAREVKRVLLDGAAPDNVVVTGANLSGMTPRVTEAFRMAGVPLASALSPRLSQASVVRELLAVLALPQGDWRHADLLRVITSPAFTGLDRSSLVSAKSAAFAGPRAATEYAIRRLLLPKGRHALLDQLQREIAFANSRSAQEEREPRREELRDQVANEHAAELVTSLSDSLDSLPSKAAPIAWFDAFRSLLDRLGYQGADPEADLAALDTLEGVCASTERLARWRGEAVPQLSLTEAVDMVSSSAAQLRLEGTPSEEGRVRLLPLEAALCERPQHLFVIGLAEGALPRSMVASDPFATVSPDQRELHQQREMQRFHQLVTSASQSVTLSYAALDAAAQPINPSSFVAEVERLFLPRSLRISPGEEDAGIALCAAGLRGRAVRGLSHGDGEELLRFARDNAADAPAAALLDGLAVTLDRSTGEFGPAEGVLAGAAAQAEFAERYGPEHHWSPSQLELYAECPFKFFMRNGLGVEPLDPLTLNVDYRRRGSLLHDTMVRFHQELNQATTEITDEQFLERFVAAVEAAADVIAASPHERPLVRVEAMQAIAWAPHYREQYAKYEKQSASQQEPMRPAYFEARFGPSCSGEITDEVLSTDDPFRLPLGGEELLLTGRIDRIDIGVVEGQTVFNVVDYKTASLVRATADDARHGRKLQLILYALAAERLLLQDQDAIAWRLGYWAVRGGGFKPPTENRKELTAGETTENGDVRPTDAWQVLEGEIVERLQAIVAGIRRGEFPMRNPDENCGGACEFSGVCRVAQARGAGKLLVSEEEIAASESAAAGGSS